MLDQGVLPIRAIPCVLTILVCLTRLALLGFELRTFVEDVLTIWHQIKQPLCLVWMLSYRSGSGTIYGRDTLHSCLRVRQATVLAYAHHP